MKRCSSVSFKRIGLVDCIFSKCSGLTIILASFFGHRKVLVTKATSFFNGMGNEFGGKET